MKDFLQLPETRRYSIANIRLAGTGPGAFGDLTQLHVDGDRICGAHDGPEVDGGGAVVLPLLTDMHTHLDKGHIWPRAPNRNGTFESALETVKADRTSNWTAGDVQRRMEFSLRCAHAHGTGAIRTHLDSAAPQHRITWPVFDRVRSDWAGRIELQAVTILGIDAVDDTGDFRDIAETAARHGGVLGCVTYPLPDLEHRLDLFFSIAAELGMDADFHVDESSDNSVRTLSTIADAVLRHDVRQQVVVGHCCSLALYPDAAASACLDRVAEAGIAVVSLPMCNMYLQDRQAGRTPRWRGVTLVHEMMDRGIDVAFASDNTRDPFYAYGDLDMIEVIREATRICQLDHSDIHWFDSFARIPNRICGFAGNRLEAGAPADFMICNARNWSELLPRPQSDRVVVRGGRAIDRTLPDYRELDDLMEAT